MRIRRRKQRTSGGRDSALHQGREQRAKTFRSLHSVGDQVTGRYLKRDDSGLAWVSFDGLPLLTKIDGNPRPGFLLHFLIQSLTPDIELRQIQGKAGSGRGPTQTVVDFDTARNAFESATRTKILAQALPQLSQSSASQKRSAFLSALTADEAFLYFTALSGLVAINYHLAQSGTARLHYLPWLLPALRCDAIFRSEEKDDGTTYQELAFGFESPSLGPGQIRILSRTGRTGVRVFLEQTSHIPVARALLKGLGTSLDSSITLLGADAPPQYAKGGILSQLLSPTPHKLLGLGG